MKYMNLSSVIGPYPVGGSLKETKTDFAEQKEFLFPGSSQYVKRKVCKIRFLPHTQLLWHSLSMTQPAGGPCSLCLTIIFGAADAT